MQFAGPEPVLLVRGGEPLGASGGGVPGGPTGTAAEQVGHGGAKEGGRGLGGGCGRPHFPSIQPTPIRTTQMAVMAIIISTCHQALMPAGPSSQDDWSHARASSEGGQPSPVTARTLAWALALQGCRHGDQSPQVPTWHLLGYVGVGVIATGGVSSGEGGIVRAQGNPVGKGAARGWSPHNTMHAPLLLPSNGRSPFECRAQHHQNS